MNNMWVCGLCKHEELVRRTTEGKRFVLHHCPHWGGRVAPGHGRNKRTYEYEGIEINVFPLKNP